VLIIEETAKVTIASPLTPDPQVEEFKLAVDRGSYEHLNEDGDSWDHARYGRFTFGPHPEKKDIEFWLHDINDTVTAEYSGTTSYEGLDVIEYSMSESGPVTKNTELVATYTGMAYYYGSGILNGLNYQEDSSVYVDEVSGLIVYIDRNIEFSGDVTFLATNETQTVTFSKMSYEFDEETTDDLVGQAKEADDTLNFYEITIPWAFLLGGSGILGFTVLWHVRKYRKAKAKPQTDEIPA
jgi:hypothetical protein